MAPKRGVVPALWRPVAVAAGLVLGAVTSCASSTGGRAGRADTVGVSLGRAAYEQGSTSLAADLDALAAIGVRWIRVDVDWSSIEPTPGAPDWAALDAVLDAAAARRMSVLGLLAYTPAWARPAATTDKHPPDDVATFARFAGAAAAHAAGRVAAWEVWNEPNTARFWEPAPDARRYASLLAAAATALRAAAPGAVVISGGLAPAVDGTDELSPETFVQQLLATGALDTVDGVAVHPYGYPALPSDRTVSWNTFARLPRLHAALAKGRRPAPPLWLTEIGAPTGTSPTAVSDERQRRIVADAIAAAGRLGWVARTFVYTHRDTDAGDGDAEARFGLLRHDRTPKPAWRALADALAG